jgi:hypothetical protein
MLDLYLIKIDIVNEHLINFTKFKSTKYRFQRWGILKSRFTEYKKKREKYETHYRGKGDRIAPSMGPGLAPAAQAWTRAHG